MTSRSNSRSATDVALRGMFRIGVWAAMLTGGVAMIALGFGPRTGAYQTLTVLTGSMRPAIDPGSLVVVRPVSAGSIRTGDVVTMNAPIEGSPVVTHRVVEIVEPGQRPVIRTQGDANAAPDPWTARIEGGRVWKVSWSVPHVGAVLARLRSPAMRSVLLYGLPAMLVLWWLADIWGFSFGRRSCAVRPRRGGRPRVAATLARGAHARS